MFLRKPLFLLPISTLAITRDASKPSKNVAKADTKPATRAETEENLKTIDAGLHRLSASSSFKFLLDDLNPLMKSMDKLIDDLNKKKIPDNKKSEELTAMFKKS